MSVNVKENGNLTKVGGLYIPSQFPHDDTKADQDSIANVENGTTASQAYSVGEFFYHNGDFCVVTQAIASGATLTENTNYTVEQVADYLHDTNTTYTMTGSLVNGNLPEIILTDSDNISQEVIIPEYADVTHDSAIAYVNFNFTKASKAYSKGDLFYYYTGWETSQNVIKRLVKRLCVATADIANGATLTEGTNFAYVNVADYLTIKKANITLNSNLTWLSMTNANRVCRRYGNMVEFRGYFTVASMPQLTSNTTFFTLPWTKTGATAFCQVRSNLSGYPMVSESFRVPSDSKNIIVQSGVQLPDAGYYIQITYMTEDAF